jgi:hypothetical protein
MRYLYIEYQNPDYRYGLKLIKYQFADSDTKFANTGDGRDVYDMNGIKNCGSCGNNIYTLIIYTLIIDLNIFITIKDKSLMSRLVELINLAYQDNRSKKLKNILG